MKKKLLFFISAIVTCGASAQMSIPNGNFESWTSATYQYPTGYIQNSNPQAFYQCHTPFNVTQSTDAYHGSFALQLTTNAMAPDTCFGYIANPTGGLNGGGPSSWTGGMPIFQKPTGIRGYYKYNVASADSALILVVARQGGTNIGTYFYTLGGIHSTYTLFQFTFSPALLVIPDSIIFATVSSNPNTNGIPGSTLLMDSVSFTGITSQPSQMNGDFETWSSQTLENPDFWAMQNGGGNSLGSVIKTTDKAAGNFALELNTYLGDNNGVPIARGGYASNGYWDNSCSCQKGGYPFSNQVDTLVFSYKYAPADPSDSASVYVNFKSAGSSFYNIGTHLHAAATYQTMEIPFNLFSAPDTAIVQIQSSDWADSTLNFVGAVLKIDEIHFKSQPLSTGINAFHITNEVSFYPNPFRTTGTIQIGSEINTVGMEVTIYDSFGRTVKKLETSEHKIIIDRNDLKNGIYFYELKTNSGIIKKGKVIIE